MEKIKAVFIIEMMGRPADYIKEAIKVILQKLEAEKGIKIINKKIAEPKQIEGKEMFSAFVEVELDADNFYIMTNVMFRYMPSHVEIIEPEKLSISNAEINGVFNDLMIKLHRYDELAKILSVEKEILMRQIVQLKKGIPVGTISKVEPKKEEQKEDVKSKKSRKIKKVSKKKRR